MKKKQATISDVAKRAGVSIATVSRVINNPDLVVPESAEKVHKAIKELSYETNILASGLKKGTTKVIGLIVPRLTNVFFMQVMEGLELTIAPKGYSIILAVSENDPEKEKRLIDKISSYMVDGLIIATSNTDSDFFLHMKKPTVLIDRRLNNAKVDMVSDENYLSAYRLTNIVIEAGHTRIGILNGLLKHLPMMQERYQGVVDALKEAGLPVQKEYLIEGKNGHNADVDDVYKVMKTWIAKGGVPSAIVSLNGKQTENALLAAKKLHLLIPDDISMVSFGQMSSELIEPKMTCVLQDGHRIGAKAGEILLQRLEDRNTISIRQDIIFECAIEMGESVRILKK